ncbi:hypothetical protein C5C53_07360 [Rathayibacter sp. AY1E3]|uniref:NACHT domain-containing protein n=1 Tax=Rathayibacter sp. AY1E3 TaxID=2080551 RepID=UPI000CE831BC|nr:NACHT domain-containing protein [Rathayibacter sp. AY1E3]PPH37615.1 hypothetical protein C5C53_07360 [Rathayibacter sp. AY1E3]
MDYLFEQLGAEDFQAFCQALLLKEYSDLQCFPVGQPDGGRDALSRGDGSLPHTVAQIKFKRSDEEDNADWLIAALKLELPKIENLRKRAVGKYVMVTNARGTSHLDVGRIDRAQEWLKNNCPVDAMILWRDDLSRRLDGANDLKLSYPGLLTGAAALSLVIDAHLGSRSDQISATLKSFAADQFRSDGEVKFRQVDLSNSLSSLFVDVPTDVTRIVLGAPEKAYRAKSEELTAAMQQMLPFRTQRRRPQYASRGMYALNTADLLLSQRIQTLTPKVVIQGAPGQGKSTLAQYVCQVHRARFLDKQTFLSSIPQKHRDSPFRFPIKIDLRDLAAFFAGNDFLGQLAESREPQRTLERFLATLIRTLGNSDDFTVDDVRSVLQKTPSILFFDGLDEVADAKQRDDVIHRLLSGINRLEESGAQIQVVVTSRPAQLNQAPRMLSEFARYDLAPLDDGTIIQYAEKWASAKKLSASRAAEVQKILLEKLDVPHVAQLTTNPMQLTILLTLIFSVGHSLPDVRTDLYREYVNLFMTREAEKDDVVRVHKTLLLEIVAYLAWELQSSAEADRTAGSIQQSDLLALVENYLMAADHDRSIVGDLFDRGLERIYVLVQRVGGRYEFEVQPLREYFAAKYLYSSAPVSNYRVKVVHGDRLERFEAMAANPYWSNVLRFYAGFWEPGEVGSLSASLKEMIGTKDVSASINVRAVGAALLTDRIFSAKKYIQKDVVDHTFDTLGVRLAAIGRLSGYDVIQLPEECGQNRLALKIFEEQISAQDAKPNAAVCILLRRNGGRELSTQFSHWIAEADRSEVTHRIRIAAMSGAVASMATDDIDAYVFDRDLTEAEVRARANAVLADPLLDLTAHPELAKIGAQEVLLWGRTPYLGRPDDLGRLSRVLSRPFPIHFERGVESEAAVIPSKLRAALDAVPSLAASDLNSSHRNLGDMLEEHLAALSSAFGECWSIQQAAILGVGRFDVKSVKSDEDIDLRSLVSQAAKARLWRGRQQWWGERMASNDSRRHLFWLALLLAWGSSGQVQQSLSLIGEAVEGLSEDNYERLCSVLQEADRARLERGGKRRTPVKIPSGISTKLAKVVFLAFGSEQYELLPKSLREDDFFVLFLSIQQNIRKLESFPGWASVKQAQWKNWLAHLRENKLVPHEYKRQSVLRERLCHDMPFSVAKIIVNDALAYPLEVVQTAVTTIQREHQPEVVRAIANRDLWQFD